MLKILIALLLISFGHARTRKGPRASCQATYLTQINVDTSCATEQYCYMVIYFVGQYGSFMLVTELEPDHQGKRNWNMCLQCVIRGT
jgi:hypothetical protein